MFEREAQVVDPPQEEPLAENENERDPSLVFFWIAVACVVAGLLSITTGVCFVFGIPVGAIVLGTLLLMLGILLGMD